MDGPLSSSPPEDSGHLKPAVIFFAGRVGGNQALVLDPHDSRNKEKLEKFPDAAPIFSLRDGFNLSGFRDVMLWKYAMLECLGTMMVAFNTSWVAVHAPTSSNTPGSTLTTNNLYSTPRFLAPLVGGLVNWVTITLFVYAFSNVSGAHLNPTITMATFFARIISFPRFVAYIAGQTAGGALAGLILARAYGTSDFEVGGCAIQTTSVPVSDAFVLEFIYTLMLIFLSFGVGLDPRQAKIIGPALSPWLVGLGLGLLSFGSAFTREGFSGASMNPARCFGAFVGSRFPGYHWIHWVFTNPVFSALSIFMLIFWFAKVGPLLAAVGHGIVYAIVPPWQVQHM